MTKKILEFFFTEMQQVFEQVVAIFLALGESGLDTVDSWFPGLKAADSMLIVIGVFFALFLGYSEIARSITAPLTGGRAESPLVIGIRAFGALFATGFSVQLVREFVQVVMQFYTMILKDIPAGWEGGVDTLSQVLDAPNLGIIPRLALIVYLCFNLLKLAISVLEHFIILVLSVHIAPIATAFVTTSDSTSVFMTYLKSIMNQCIYLIITAWGLRAFENSFGNVELLDTLQSSSDGSQGFLFFLACGIFSDVLTNLEQILSSLGFSGIAVARSTEDLSRAAQVGLHAAAHSIGNASTKAFSKIRGNSSSGTVTPDTLRAKRNSGDFALNRLAAAKTAAQNSFNSTKPFSSSLKSVGEAGRTLVTGKNSDGSVQSKNLFSRGNDAATAGAYMHGKTAEQSQNSISTKSANDYYGLTPNKQGIYFTSDRTAGNEHFAAMSKIGEDSTLCTYASVGKDNKITSNNLGVVSHSHEAAQNAVNILNNSAEMRTEGYHFELTGSSFNMGRSAGEGKGMDKTYEIKRVADKKTPEHSESSEKNKK